MQIVEERSVAEHVEIELAHLAVVVQCLNSHIAHGVLCYRGIGLGYVDITHCHSCLALQARSVIFKRVLEHGRQVFCVV